MARKTIVISAVNLRVGGTLTILRDCLSYLSSLAAAGDYEVVALVYKRELADYAHIRYIETQWPKKSWVNRLWYEYISLKDISKAIGPVHLWLSLHDTTPNVVAEKRAVYCHNPYPFYDWKWQEWFLSPKIVLFALCSEFIYRKNIRKNDFVIVQQQWLKDAFKQLFKLPQDKIVVALPDAPKWTARPADHLRSHGQDYVFVYAASPNSHKNFECICKAADILKAEGLYQFKVYLTVSGTENTYAEWLYKRWGKSNAVLEFIGFQDRQTLFVYYDEADCLLFPSRVETWGLPITEFAALEKPMLLADLPYTHETAAGAGQVAFFDPAAPEELAAKMKRLIQGDTTFLQALPLKQVEPPVVRSWAALFDILLQTREGA